MRKEYLIRKYIPIVATIIWAIAYVLVVFLASDYMILMLGIFIVGFMFLPGLKPKKTEWCFCGHKWKTKHTYEDTYYHETEKDKDGSYKIVYTHYFKADCVCPNCKRKYSFILTGKGGYEVIDRNGKKTSYKIKQNIYMQRKDLLEYHKKYNNNIKQ